MNKLIPQNELPRHTMVFIGTERYMFIGMERELGQWDDLQGGVFLFNMKGLFRKKENGYYLT